MVVALYVDEPLSPDARAVLGAAAAQRVPLHAPDLLLAECANALRERTLRGELEAAEGMQAVRDLGAISELTLRAVDGDLAARVLALGLAHSITAYDATYVALAVELGCVMVTGDERLAAQARDRSLPVATAAAYAAG